MARKCFHLIALAWMCAAACLARGQSSPPARSPQIKPDYTGLIIPPNIAPLNFEVLEPGDDFRVSIRGQNGPSLEISSRSPVIKFKEKDWNNLMAHNQGAGVAMELRVHDKGQWTSFTPITNRVAAEEIDPVLIYRRIHPAHSSWSTMGIYQRDLRTFSETPILENRRFDNGCCHCHVLRDNDPNNLMILVRSQNYKNGLLIVSNGQPMMLQGSVGFSAFHPKTRFVVCSINKPRLLLHTAKENDMRDIGELEGSLGGFQMGSDTVKKLPFSDPALLLAFPVWSPDGSWLYYCSAPKPTTNFSQAISTVYSRIKYDLMRAAYDAAADKWGEPQTVVPARELGLSVAQPRISPDGRWIFFCGTAYSCWPTYDPKSDFYGIDLVNAAEKGQFSWRKLEINSDQAESILNWSSNSRWIVFSSKRGNPLFNRPWLARVSPSGELSKPFILPQEDPSFYDSFLDTFTIPTLAKGPVTVPQKDLVSAIKQRGKKNLVVPDQPVTKKTGANSGQMDHP